MKLPCGFALNENTPRSPERALLGSIILTAVLDALKDQPPPYCIPQKYKAKKKAELTENALEWLGIIKNPSVYVEHPLTFEFCCAGIDRDPERVRNAIVKFLQEHNRISYFPNPPIIERVTRQG